MGLRVFAAALVLASVGAPRALAADPEKKPSAEPRSEDGPQVPKSLSEPVKCYKLIGLADEEMTVGLAVEVCAATPNAIRTVDCYASAFMPAEAGGLGLPRGVAIDLCRTIPRERL